MSPEQIQAENESMLNTLAVLAENRRLRNLLASQGISAPSAPRTHLADLALIVCETYGTSVEDIRGPSRAREVVQARDHLMWQARQIMTATGAHRFSLPEIGRFLHRHHASIMEGVKRHISRTSEPLPQGQESDVNTPT